MRFRLWRRVMRLSHLFVALLKFMHTGTGDKIWRERERDVFVFLNMMILFIFDWISNLFDNDYYYYYS